MPRKTEPTETTTNWQTALADAAQRTQDIRREAVVRDVGRWLEVCQGIAAGREPDGRTLAEIAEIADRLSLPHNALADDVAAVAEHKRLVDKAASKRTEREALEAQAPELQKALADAKNEVERITFLFRRMTSLTGSEIAISQSAGTVRANNPRLFQPAEIVADSVIGVRSRLSGELVSTGAAS